MSVDEVEGVLSPLPAALSPRRHVKKKKYSMYACDVRALARVTPASA